MTQFPAVKPTSRRITQGDYAVKRFTSISGTGTTRAYGSKPFNSLLDLSFENISDAIAVQIANCYEVARGSYDALTLPAEVWDGMDQRLRELLQKDYSWRFSSKPQITSGPSGISSVTISLEGHRDG